MALGADKWLAMVPDPVSLVEPNCAIVVGVTAIPVGRILLATATWRSIGIAVLLLSGSCGSVAAQKILVGMGNFEPYFVADGETGIFTDVLKAVFREIPEYEPEFVFGHSNKGLWVSFAAGRLDAVANLFDSVDLDACRSDPIFRFRDVAVTLTANNIQLTSVAFEGAKHFFGEEFTGVIDPANYQEVRKPELQARMLFGGRYKVSVGDMFIFLDALAKLKGIGAGLNQVTFHHLFPPIETRMGFKNAELCRQFNVALKSVKDSGEYEAIYQRYLHTLEALTSGGDNSISSTALFKEE
jgi:polar amino acid transport system substrate-binding protein